jgi:large subunit ribosomal protein L6
MSRKGKLPIPLPKGVEVKVVGSQITVKGPKGTLNQQLHPSVIAKVENNEVIVTLKEGHEDQGNFHGLSRTLIDNLVFGTTNGYEKKLEMVGVGYRAAVTGHILDLQIGFSHPTKLTIPEGLHVKVEKNTAIFISGIDKQKVGQFAATVRAIRPPEPYQGKGIKYSDEHIRRKAGKSASAKK